jgi:basic membrane protein A and related proteins
MMTFLSGGRFTMKLSKIFSWSAVAVGAVMALGTTAQAADKLKVGFVYVAPIGDHGYTFQHDVGRKAIEEAFGDKIETTFVENVAEGPDAERVIRQLAQGGNDIIFTTSFGFMNPTLKVAKKFPKVKFEHATGFKRDKNMSTYNIRFYEGRYIAGKLAGRTTKSNTIGYIASFPIPEVVRGINATYLGAKSVNPDIKMKIVWVSSWFDPGKEADATKALRDQGADVIMQHTDSSAPIKIAEQEGVKAIGQASDMISVGPNAQMTAIIDNWAPYYIARVQAVMDGTWKEEDTWGGLKSGMLTIAPFNPNLPADVIAEATATKEGITDGSIQVFKGPIVKQDGTVVVKEGEVADDGLLAGMNFYVQGIEGTLPN